MFALKFKTISNVVTLLIVTSLMMLVPLSCIKAADHADSTSVAGDPGADIADVFAFLDPNDNSKVVLAMTFEGFIVPAEQLNIGAFAPDILYRFEIENSGDAIPDQFIDITFAPQTSRTVPQIATIGLPTRKTSIRLSYKTAFTAPTTVSNLTATSAPFVVTTDPSSGISFFAGLTDDPFYFDILGFGRFSSSLMSGSPNPTRLQRARDSFAGYNIHTIALEVPVSLLRGSSNTIGIDSVTLRRRFVVRQDSGQIDGSGDYVPVDRFGVPTINTVLVPFPRKNEYNVSNTQDDANGKFAASMTATMVALGMTPTNISIISSVAITKGDFLRLNLSSSNSSLGFGEKITTPNYTGFPNGRRLGDDTIDTLIFYITNQTITTGDNVNSNEVPLTNAFPFFGRPHQPLENPAVDPTQN